MAIEGQIAVLSFTITKVEPHGWSFLLHGDGVAPVLVDADFYAKHAPQPGGTYSRWKNGDAVYDPPER